jgi:hypothetical protein
VISYEVFDPEKDYKYTGKSNVSGDVEFGKKKLRMVRKTQKNKSVGLGPRTNNESHRHRDPSASSNAKRF